MGKTNDKGLLTITIDATKGKVHDNTSEEYIAINESKARLIYKDFIQKGNYSTLFFTFLSLFLTCLIACFTANFKDVLGIENAGIIIFLIFILMTISFFITTIIFLWLWIKNRKKYNEEEFIIRLKNSDN